MCAPYPPNHTAAPHSLLFAHGPRHAVPSPALYDIMQCLPCLWDPGCTIMILFLVIFFLLFLWTALSMPIGIYSCSNFPVTEDKSVSFILHICQMGIVKVLDVPLPLSWCESPRRRVTGKGFPNYKCGANTDCCRYHLFWTFWSNNGVCGSGTVLNGGVVTVCIFVTAVLSFRNLCSSHCQ